MCLVVNVDMYVDAQKGSWKDRHQTLESGSNPEQD